MLGSGQLQKGLAGALQRHERLGLAAVPGTLQRGRELLEAAPGDISQEFDGVAEMPVGRRRGNASPARRFGEGKAGRAFLRDQLQRRADQRFAQVAVVIATRAVLPGPAHVKGLYMTPRGASRLPHGAAQITPIAASTSASSSLRGSPARERTAS